MAVDINDLVAAVGIAPKIGQVPARPTGQAGWAKAPVGDSPDLQRILKIPRRQGPTDAEEKLLTEAITAKYRRDRTSLGPCQCHAIRPDVENPCITDLRLAQSWALLELELVGGLVGAIGVGHGKTLLDILAPLAMPNCRTALLLVKPDLVAQLIVEYDLASQHFRVPTLVVHNGSDYSRIVPGAPVMHVMPFSRLSRRNATVFIDTLRPDFILIDEVQKIKDRNTATASRVLRYFVAHPETRFAGWTGTLTDKSLNDYGHISALALRFQSPLPLDPVALDDWARALDPSDFPAPAGALFQLCDDGEHVQSGYHRRLTETMGVVATRKAAVDAHLVVTERKSPPIPNVIKDALSMVRDSWCRPDGEELVEAFEVAKSAREVACGFYYRWKFVNGETEAQIKAWLAARKAWNKELRGKLQSREEYLDSPLLCQEAAVRAWGGELADACKYCKGSGEVWELHDGECSEFSDRGDCDLCEEFEPQFKVVCIPCGGTGKTPTAHLPEWKADSWPEWRDVKGTVKPETEAIRIDPYLAQDAADWGLSNRGVIWYGYGALGHWIGELSGLPVHGGGPKAAQVIAQEKGDRSIIASIHAHGTGRDGLQRLFTEQLVTNPPSSATAWEQLLGRLHRIGQEADRVTAQVYRHTKEFRDSVDKAMARALYVEETLGAPQKLRAGYSLGE